MSVSGMPIIRLRLSWKGYKWGMGYGKGRLDLFEYTIENT